MINKRLLCRGLHKGLWVYGYYFETNGNPRILVLDKNISYGIDSDTAGQYTGKEDIHGTKIFEGDICNAVYVGLKYPAVVIFRNGSFGLQWKHNGHEHFAPFTSFVESAEFEVIGNKTDNLELLEEAENG